MEIFKDERIKKIVEYIRESIKNTRFEGKVFITGGTLRNSILNLPINDLDIVIDSDIRDGAKAFGYFMTLKYRCYVKGANPVVFESYGTTKFQLLMDDDLKDVQIECNVAKNSDGELCTIEENAKCRDLSINALMYNISSDSLYDHNHCAINDMRAKTLRTPYNAEVILEKDPIKILRIIRFATEYGWGIERKTWLGMIKNAHLIKNVAQERITNEITKILLCEKPSVGIMKMYNCGVLGEVMPDIYDTTSAYESKNPMVTTFEHTLKVLDTVLPYIENRLAALYHDVGKIVMLRQRDGDLDKFSSDVAKFDLTEMKYPNHVIKAVQTAIRYHRYFDIYSDGTIPSDKKIRKYANIVGDNLAVTSDLMNANNLHRTYGKKKTQVLKVLDRIEELDKIEEAANVKLPIDGNEIIKEFKLKPSPLIGILLDEVKDAYFENPSLTKDEAFELVEKKLSKIV